MVLKKEGTIYREMVKKLVRRREMGETCISNDERMDLKFTEEESKVVLHLERCLNPEGRDGVLLILNQAINIGDLFADLWQNYTLRVCADGGANRLYNYFDNEEARRSHLPDYIVGDLDSLQAPIREFYEKNGVAVIRQTTQYSTDFTKSVHLSVLHMVSQTFRDQITHGKKDNNYGIALEKGLHELFAEMKTSQSSFSEIEMLAIGAIDGRFDQTIHSITQLYTLATSDDYMNLRFLTPTDLIFLVRKHGTLIRYTPEFLEECVGNCGLLPISSPAVITETRGLKWDIANWPTSIASGRVSTNNRFVGTTGCYINSTDHLVLNVELKLDRLLNHL